MTAPIIQVDGFRKLYAGVPVVDGISFDVAPGEVFGLLGPNGSGKTTTLESLEGLRRPDGGTLRVCGIDPSRPGSQLSTLIGVQLQSSGLPDSYRVAEIMRLFCSYHGVAPRTDLIERVGLATSIHTEYRALSGGQQRRLALAIAVIHNPAVLILDEPTSGLDVASRTMLHELIRELQSGGTTVLLATHDMAEASALATRVAILLRGRIAALGTPLELTATGAGLTRITVRTENGSLLRDSSPVPAVSRSIGRDPYSVYFTTDVGATVTDLIDKVAAHSDSLVDLRVERPSLEDRFLEITADGGNR